MYDVRALASGSNLAVLLELKGIKWNVIGLSEVRRMGEAFMVLPD